MAVWKPILSEGAAAANFGAAVLCVVAAVTVAVVECLVCVVAASEWLLVWVWA